MANLRLLTLNDVKIAGRLTRDPEVRYTSSGIAVARLSVAVGRKYKDKTSDEWKEEVAFVSCTVWREQADRVGQRLKKGSPVFVEGRLKTKQWQTKEGQKRSDLEVEVQKIQFLESMSDGEGQGSQSSASAGSNQPVPAGIAEEQSDDNEVPF